jgi:hypothetical protein
MALSACQHLPAGSEEDALLAEFCALLLDQVVPDSAKQWRKLLEAAKLVRDLTKVRGGRKLRAQLTGGGAT